MRRLLDPAPVPRLRFLLLEDSSLDARIIEAGLAGAAFDAEITRVTSREAFIEALEAGSFDLILSDYRVPGFDGEEALALAAARLPEVPFIFVSGALGEDKAIDLVKRGATDYVLKDRLERLVPSVQRALRERAEIAERRRAEDALRERERTLSTLISNLPGMAFRRDHLRPWRIVFASEGCLSLCGHAPERLYDPAHPGWEAVVHPEDVDRFARELDDAIAQRRQLTTTYRIRTADGEVRWVWERSTIQRRPDGTIGAVEGFASDITAQKAAELELRQRVEFEEQLIGIVSHDLRNPLNAISLGASILLKRQGLDDASTASVRRILGSAERAGRMIRDLLDFTQIRLGDGLPIQRRPCQLSSVLMQVLEEFEYTHPGRQIVLDAAPDGAMCGEWDPDRIAQALTNLICNAVTYSPPETPVTLRATGDAETVEVAVHNQGEPIPADRIPRLFRPLSRASREVAHHRRSIGLGLFIVHSIARAHRGEVSVRSTAEEGTTFTLRLPRHPPTGAIG